MLELHLHGSTAVIKAVLSSLSSLQGFRPAEPGEFTKLAFDNGRMDLTEVEGLRDLIESETEAQRKLAVHQAGVSVVASLAGIEDSLTHQMTASCRDTCELRTMPCESQSFPPCLFSKRSSISARMRASMNSITTQVSLHTPVMPTSSFKKCSSPSYSHAARQKIQQLRALIVQSLEKADRGEIIRNGARVAIFGAPNAGKSSFLNWLGKAWLNPVLRRCRQH